MISSPKKQMSLKERYISGILTAEDNGTEVTGTGLCQPVYFLNDILNQNAVSHASARVE